MRHGSALYPRVDAAASGIDAEAKGQHDGKQWQVGDAPEKPLTGAIDMIAKAGTIAVVGLYPPGWKGFDFGSAFAKNLTIRMGNCPHRRYLPDLIRMVANGTVRPSRILAKRTAFDQAIEAYKAFDRHEDGWLKVELLPSSHAVAATKGEVVTA